MTELLQYIEEYLRDVALKVPSLVREGRGTEILGKVPGRPESEDVEVEVDRICDDLLDDHLRKAGVNVEIFSEHGTRRIGGTGPAKHLISIDPFDGSGLFLRGIPADWWSVLSFFRTEDLTPFGGGAIDILRKELYLAEEHKVTVISLEDQSQVEVFPSKKTTMDNETVIAAYLMNPSYLKGWTEGASGLVDRLNQSLPGVRLWPNGGSCIYPWLARGLVHAYVMFDEPRSEIDPGLAFPWAAGYPVYSVDGEGQLAPYSFRLGTQGDRVPFFISACTHELAQEIVSAIMGTR